jgi:hypothetical protein
MKVDLDEQIRRKDIARQMADETYVGMLAFAIKETEKSTPPTVDALQSAKILLQRGPHGLHAVLDLYLDFHLKERAERWDWERWESYDQPSGHAYMSRTDEFVDRAFSLLIMQSIEQSDSEFNKGIEALAYKARRDAHLFKKDDGIWKFISLMRSQVERFGIENVSEQNIQTLEKRTEAIKKRAETLLAQDISAQDLLTKKVDDFRSSFEKSFLEQAKLRNVFGSASRDFNDQKEWWGVSTWLDREMFIESPRVHYTDFGKSFGKDLGSSEDGYIFSLLRNAGAKVSDGIAQAINQLIARGIRPDDIVILASKDPEIFSWIKEANYTPAYRLLESKTRIDGRIKIGEHEYDLFNVWLPDRELDAVLICCRSEVEILFRKPVPTAEKQAVCESFEFSVTDPKYDEKLQLDLVKANPAWLTTFNDSDQKLLSGLKVWLRILQYRQAVLKLPDSVLVLPLIPEINPT